MKKNTMMITRRELKELNQLYRKDMEEIEALYHEGQINYQDRGALKRYVWEKEMYRPLAKQRAGLLEIC